MLGFGALGELALGQASDDGAFVITGHDVGLYVTRYLTAETGVFTITTSSVELVRSRDGLQVVSGGGVSRLKASAGGGGSGLRIRA